MIDDYEEFTESQVKTLERYVTNTSGHVFVLRNLPEVIKGALFSRYSRSSLGLRSLLLKEFITNDETAFASIVGHSSDAENPEDQVLAIKRAQNFYDRILDGYGDDSIGELGGAHLAVENISMLAAKIIEDSRVGGSPLEKSTRYIYFDQKVKGEFLFYREPILMTSAFRDVYLETCNMLFETYSRLIPPMTAIMEARFPKEAEVSKIAYNSALRAKVLDCLRGLLPAATLTNMGMYGNGRFFEYLLHKLHCNNLVELQETSKRAYDELSQVIPSFVRRSDPEHRTHQGFAQYYDATHTQLRLITEQFAGNPAGESTTSGVRLVDFDEDSITKIAAALLFPYSERGLPELQQHVKTLSEEEIATILDAAASSRENRRHKSPRALEHAEFTFEILADFGVYRDLHRHRILTQERQRLTCNYGFWIPPEILGTEIESDYYEALCRAKEVFDMIAVELPEEAQYVVPMAFNIRWYFHINLRGLQWMCELRSQAAGHPTYRHIAQEMAKQVCAQFPAFERFFKFVDYDGYELGRLGQEQRQAEKQQQRAQS
ncbi:MAG: FAD-dependent thymidylate synthase [Chlamydiales bacterium]|nr:FAD-dependent thymidylate synthase [Chlamydiales bacterium]